MKGKLRQKSLQRTQQYHEANEDTRKLALGSHLTASYTHPTLQSYRTTWSSKPLDKKSHSWNATQHNSYIMKCDACGLAADILEASQAMDTLPGPGFRVRSRRVSLRGGQRLKHVTDRFATYS
eukprot:3039382-Amphidinium_carterae.1